MRILICSDGSKWAHRSARFALQLFGATNHDVTVLAFEHRASEMTPPKESMTRQTRRKSDDTGSARPPDVIEDEIRNLVDELAVDANALTWQRGEGNMNDHILDISGDFDLVCVGGAGKGGFSSNMLGLTADEFIRRGRGNLMVTKTSDAVCRDVLVPLTPKSISDDLAHYLGQMFEGTPASLTIDVLWEDLPTRFEGYLDAAVGRKLKQMVDSELFDNPERLQNIVDIIDSYGVDAASSYQDYPSLEMMIDDVEPTGYDLIVVHPPTRQSGLLRMLEPDKQNLNLMRKSATNVMLLRSIHRAEPSEPSES